MAAGASLSSATADSNEVAVNRMLPDKQVSYIRNSVKATVDAYDGTVTLYEQDEHDPVLQAWMKVFPDTVKPKSEISADLQAHLRYPEDLFKVQREILALIANWRARTGMNPIDPKVLEKFGIQIDDRYKAVVDIARQQSATPGGESLIKAGPSELSLAPSAAAEAGAAMAEEKPS